MNTILVEWEQGKDYTFEQIKSKALQSYRNLVARYDQDGRSWAGVVKSTDQIDSRDAQIQALTTELNSLKRAHPSSNADPHASVPGEKIRIADWRKKKKQGDTCFCNGRQWWWCPEHKFKDEFDGLYVTHQLGAGHQQWLKRRRRGK